MSALVARDTDTDTVTTISTRPSTATTTSSTMNAATTPRTSSTTNDTRKSTLVHQTPSYPPPPPPQQQHQQETHQPQTVSSSVPRSLWSLRRSRSSARILALASTREYVHAKLCGANGLPSPSAPGKNLFPAPQGQQKKKPIDIHDPEWLARHGLKWDARGLGLVSAAV